MHRSERSPSSLTRRAVIGGAAGLAAGVVCATGRPVAAQSGAATPTVLTQNAYLGVDLSRLLEANSLTDVRRIAGAFLEKVDPELYDARADALAAQVEAAGADVVALQEAAVLRTQRPGDFSSASAERAADVLVDFLARIESALADRGLDYETAATTVTTDLELPAETEDGAVDVRITDRDVLLVRGDHETGETVTDTFEAGLSLPLPGAGSQPVLRRGYCSVEVVVDGVAFTAVSTHLESVSGRLRRQQARELLDRLPTDRPVVLCGDVNSGPGGDTEAYDQLTSVFEDPYVVLDPEGEGHTCCQDADLRNDRSRLDRRIDAVLYRGDVRPTEVGRVGHRPDDRAAVERDGETARVWPSDHAGVVATVEIAAETPTPSPEPTATPSPGTTATTTRTAPPTTDTTSGGAGPGLGVVTALVSVAAALVAWLRRG